MAPGGHFVDATSSGICEQLRRMHGLLVGWVSGDCGSISVTFRGGFHAFLDIFLVEVPESELATGREVHKWRAS